MTPSMGKWTLFFFTFPFIILKSNMSIKNSTTIFTVWMTLTVLCLFFPYIPASALALVNLGFAAASMLAPKNDKVSRS